MIGLRAALSRLAGRAPTTTGPVTAQYDADYFDRLRARHDQLRLEAEQARQESLRLPRASEQVEQLLNEEDWASRAADRVARQLDWATRSLQAGCSTWGWSMPACDERGWVIGGSSCGDARNEGRVW